ncbi:kynurenine 3-monooxygenase [Ciona intestinalis]
MSSPNRGNVTIVGGGPAIGNINVDLHEAFKDIRRTDFAAGRSINLALSYRGIQSLKRAGLDEKIKSLGIAMHSRMIHPLNNPCYEIPYGRKGQYLLSIDRLKLNQDLLTGKLLFMVLQCSKCMTIKLTSNASNPVVTNWVYRLPVIIKNSGPNILLVLNRENGGNVDETSQVLFGCDGAYSAVRRQLQRGLFDYAQVYIPHGYKELCIPPTRDGEYAMPPNHLHIWPRHTFMLIALPNQDKSFTCTLFMPITKFEKLKTGDEVLDLFMRVFPDSVPLIGEEFLKKDFFNLPPLPIITVKCSPYHYKNKVALLGDAAHSMTPFFGQGLNSGLEDTLLFDELMEKYECDFDKVLPMYSEIRCPDGHAISDLSHKNYIEMRDSVTSLWFLFRKKVDSILHFIFPSLIVPKYSMVAFTRTRYSKVITDSEKNTKIINVSLIGSFAVLVGFAISAYWRTQKRESIIPEIFFTAWQCLSSTTAHFRNVFL